ncbi:MAG: hypothetical protein IKC01_06685 [Clostridia bacterium]|nr:hypothetical protein [Clostridia bacterium]
MIKDYFKRIYKGIKPIELIFWWGLRGLMIYGIVESLLTIDPNLGSMQPLQMLANLVGMFAYEICQMFPKNTFPRLLPHQFQHITIIGFFLASFGGAYLNLYYDLPMYDKVLHCFGCVEAVYISYELVCAMQIRDKVVCPPKIAALAAFGVAFVFASGWELFEFTFDQWFGGDAQHWDLQKAIQEAGGNVDDVFMLIPLDAERFESRFAIMDTMGDMILNALGAVPMYIFLRFRPYRHMGKNNINKMIEEELLKTTKEQAAV